MPQSILSSLVRGIAFAASVVFAAPSAADTLNVSVPECTTPGGGTTCDTNLNYYITPGSNVVGLYVKQDFGAAALISCIGRNPNYSQSGSIPLNWIWRQKRHEFLTADQNNCGPVTPGTSHVRAEGKDDALKFLAGPASDNTQNYGYVYRMKPGLQPQWLKFQLINMVHLGTWQMYPVWSNTTAGAQVFTRRAAHVLARLSWDANLAGVTYGNGPNGWQTKLSYTVIPQTNGTCALQQYSKQYDQYLYLRAPFNKLSDEWMYSTGFGVYNDPIYPLTFVPCGSSESDNHPYWMQRLIAYEASNPSPSRIYGVREAVWDRSVCGADTPYAYC